MAILGSLFQSDPVAKADQLYQKGELRRAAELYAKAGRDEQAAEIYAKQLGEVEVAVEILREARKPLKAAELLVSLGEAKRAISLYDEAGAHRQAAELCERERLFPRAGRFYERAAMFRKAAEAFSKAGEMEHALSAWETEIERLRSSAADPLAEAAARREIHGIEQLQIQILENLGRHLEAAQRWMKHGQPGRAVKLFEKARRFSDAALAYLQAGQPERAALALKKAPDADDDLRARIYLQIGLHGEAAENLERLGRAAEAAEAYARAERWDKAAELWEKAERPSEAARAFRESGNLLDAARCHALAGEGDAAAEVFAEAAEAHAEVGDYRQAAEAYVKALKYVEAAEAYEKIGDFKSAAETYKILDRRLDAARAYLAGGRLDTAIEELQSFAEGHSEYVEASRLLIPALLDKRLVEGARHRLDELGERLPEVDRWYWQARLDETDGRWTEAESGYQRVLAKQQSFSDAQARLSSVRNLRAKAEAASETGSHAVPMALSLPEELDVDAVLEIGREREPWWQKTTRRDVVDRRSGQAHILIRFPEGLLGDEITRFYRRMDKISRFDHAAALQLVEIGRAHGEAHLLFAAPPDGTQLLTDRIAVHPLSGTAALNVLTQLCDLLSTALKLSLTHQWISPRTLLVDSDNRIRLVGFGLRRILAQHDHTTRAYLAPEVREGHDGGPAGDVYSLGLLAAELLAAHLPWDWDQRESLEPDAVTWPDEIVALVPAPARAFLVRCLSNDPMARPSVEELKAALAVVGLLPGQLLADRYEILGELGRGGMSRVYRAKDRQFNEAVAIKTVLQSAAGASEDEDRLFREVQICRKISHPNVVRVHDFGRFPGGLFVIMEFLDGPDLDHVIKKEAPLPLGRVRTFLSEITAALSEAHRLKVVHRDLKPANVMLVKDRVKVMDFGIATMNDETAASQKLTRSGEVIGSPLYMAPEQIQGLELDGRCDLYALGVIAYTMVTGKEPFRAESSTAVIFKHLHEMPPNPRLFRENLPDAWVEMLHRLLAKKPEDRYADADALQSVLANLPLAG